MSEEKKTPQDAEETTEQGTPAEETQIPVQEAESVPEAEQQPEKQTAEEAVMTENAAEDEAEPEEDAPSTEEEQNEPPRHTFGNVLSSQKIRRCGISTVFTAVLLAVIILLNVIVSMLSTRFPSTNLDLSAQKTNSLMEDTLKVTDVVKLPTTITVLGSEAGVRDNVLYSGYGFNYSQVAVLSDKIKERNSNIVVKYIDFDENPTYASEFGETSLTVDCVVASIEKRHRVLQIIDLFSQQTDHIIGTASTCSMVGTALASAISQVNSKKLPVIAFAMGHDEIYDTTALQSVLKDVSFETVSFNMLTDEIPTNTRMVMLASSATDYTPQELKKLDTFPEDDKPTAGRSLLITFYPGQEALPNLSFFLKEWGIEVSHAMVVEYDQSHVAQFDVSFILTQANVDSIITLNSQSTRYDNVVMPQSSPINLLFTSRDGATAYTLAQSYDTPYLVDSSSTEETAKNVKQQVYTTAALVQKNLSPDGTTYKQNTIVADSSSMFAEGAINASAYGNGKYVIDLVRYATGETDSNTGTLVTPVQTSQVGINLSQVAGVILGFGVFTILISLCVLVAGLVAFLKRRHL